MAGRANYGVQMKFCMSCHYSLLWATQWHVVRVFIRRSPLACSPDLKIDTTCHSTPVGALEWQVAHVFPGHPGTSPTPSPGRKGLISRIGR